MSDKPDKPAPLALRIEDMRTVNDADLDARTLAILMLKVNDLKECALIMGCPFSYAWKLSQGSEYARAKLLAMEGVDLNDIANDKSILAGLQMEATNFFDGTPSTRIAAYRAMMDLLGLTKGQGSTLTIDTGPNIKLTLSPAQADEAVDEVVEIESEDVE